jgi:hypothetical protein
MRQQSIFTLARPFKRRVHNNYWSFLTIDSGDGFERPESPIFTTPRCPRSPKTINTRPCSILLRVGGPRAPSTAISSVERRLSAVAGRSDSAGSHAVRVGGVRCRHPARNMFFPNPRRKTATVRRPTTLLRNSAGVATSCTDSRSFLCASIQIARYHRLQAGGAGVPGVLAVARAAA